MSPFLAKNNQQLVSTTLQNGCQKYLARHNNKFPLNRKGQFFVITAVIISVILFTVAKSFSGIILNELNFQSESFEFNNLVDKFESAKKINNSESEKELKRFSEDWYSRFGFSVNITLGNCTTVRLISRQVDLEGEVC